MGRHIAGFEAVWCMSKNFELKVDYCWNLACKKIYALFKREVKGNVAFILWR